MHMSDADLAEYRQRHPHLFPSGAYAAGELHDATPPAPGLVLRARLPIEGLGVNGLYVSSGTRRRRSPAYRAWAQRAGGMLAGAEVHPLPAPAPLVLRAVLHGHWHDKAGAPRKRDTDGPVKALLDLLCAHVGVDDCWVYRIEVEKRHAVAPLMEAELWRMEVEHG